VKIGYKFSIRHINGSAASINLNLGSKTEVKVPE
jgi:hypothetical protein